MNEVDVPSDASPADARFELMLRAGGPPLVFVVCSLVIVSPTGHLLLRTFLSMWVHELGHAAAAWLCGRVAFPGPWRTPISDQRSVFVVLLVMGSFGFLAWRGWVRRAWPLVCAGAAGLVAQLVCLLLAPRTANAVITFAGDGGALVFGTLLVATVYAAPTSRFRQGALRWGLLVIGGASFLDAFVTWLRARWDFDAIPLGEIEGVGLSDASKLMQVHGWSVNRLTGTYAGLGIICLAVIVTLYVTGILSARRAGGEETR